MSKHSASPLHIAFVGLVTLPAICTTASSKPATTPAAQQPAIAITLDDLPASESADDDDPGRLREIQRRNQAILSTLHKHHAPALGLVNEYKLQVSGERDARAALLQEWLNAGMELGNHTFSHIRLSQTSLAHFDDDTVRGDVVTGTLLKLMGKHERYFRHPGLDVGKSREEEQAFEAFLKKRGYQIAPVSINFDDYKFNDALGWARSRRDPAAASRVRAAYLTTAILMLDFEADQAEVLFHRQISQILLIHDSEITSEMLDPLLTALEHRGYRLISIETALRDPAYGSQDVFAGNLGRCYLCWSYRLRAVGSTPAPPPPIPEWINRASNRARSVMRMRAIRSDDSLSSQHGVDCSQHHARHHKQGTQLDYGNGL